MEYRNRRGGYNPNYNTNKMEKIYVPKNSSEISHNQHQKKEEVSTSTQNQDKQTKNKPKEEKKAISPHQKKEVHEDKNKKEENFGGKNKKEYEQKNSKTQGKQQNDHFHEEEKYSQKFSKKKHYFRYNNETNETKHGEPRPILEKHEKNEQIRHKPSKANKKNNKETDLIEWEYYEENKKKSAKKQTKIDNEIDAIELEYFEEFQQGGKKQWKRKEDAIFSKKIRKNFNKKNKIPWEEKEERQINSNKYIKKPNYSSKSGNQKKNFHQKKEHYATFPKKYVESYSDYKRTKNRPNEPDYRDNQRKYLKKYNKLNFPEYLQKKIVDEGLKEKTLYEGIFLMNDAVRFLASIKCEAFEEKIFVQSLEQQNRALHNCTVVFRLIKKNKNQQTNKNERKKGNNYELEKIYVKKSDGKKPEIKNEIENSQANNESDWETENEEEEEKKVIEEKQEEKMIGEVVYILKNSYINRDIIGKIVNTNEEKNKKKSKSSKQNPANYMFIPNDLHLPKMFIKEIDEEPSKLIEAHSIDLNASYFKGRLLDWPHHSFYPHIQITGYLGVAGEIEVECQALLLENNVYIQEFGDKAIEHLSLYEKEQWEIPMEERKNRLDLTKTMICTIDPITARDLDDALSIEEIRPGVYEIGVHIADVSYFVKENDPVDEEAKKRTTSVYLPHRVLPMLPGILCEKLCSLNSGVERLAFSIFFQMNEKGDVVRETPPRITKTIIKSCGKLSYEVAQKIIDGEIQKLEDFPEYCKVDKNIDVEKLMNNIKKMNEIAKNRRAFRMSHGSLQFEKTKKKFVLNEQNVPISYTTEKRIEANFLVEEYMLMANIIAGETMVKHCKELALLRKHEPPQEKKVKALITFLDSLKIPEINTSNIFEIFRSIDHLKNETTKISPEMMKTINQKMIRTMQLAKYFIVDEDPEFTWHHFALNFDVYTHFTSPIRRYPDVLVHRLLFNILEHGENAKEHVNKQFMMEIMNKCNESKQASRKVSDGCDKIFSCLCMKANNFQTNTKALILSFGKSGMTISIPEYELIDFKIRFKELKKIRDIKLEENGNNKTLVLKVSTRVTEKNKGKTNKYDDDSDHYDETDAFYIDKVEYHILQEIEIKLGVKDVFPIDYNVNIGYKNKKNETVYID